MAETSFQNSFETKDGQLCGMQNKLSSHKCHSNLHIIESFPTKNHIGQRLFIPRTLVTRDQINKGVILPIINPTEETITLTSKTIIGQTEALKEETVLSVDAFQNNQSSQPS